jgi:hypothetical protein
MATFSGAATRADGDVVERAGWIDHGDGQLFTFTHVPPSPVAGLVVCSPVGAELDVNYRRETLLGRTLARRGVAVMRLHYRGSGNSSGEPAMLTVDSMIADAEAAAHHLTELIGFEVALLGTRSSSFAALGAAERTDPPAVVLWHPPLSGRAYFRDVGRLRRMNRLAQQAGRDGDDHQTIAEELAAKGRIEVAGFSIDQPLHDSLAAADLDQFELPARAAVMILHFGGSGPPPALATKVEAWDSTLRSCEALTLAESENWWFANDLEIEELRSVTADALRVTGDWLLDHGRHEEVSG